MYLYAYIQVIFTSYSCWPKLFTTGSSHLELLSTPNTGCSLEQTLQGKVTLCGLDTCSQFTNWVN